MSVWQRRHTIESSPGSANHLYHHITRGERLAVGAVGTSGIALRTKRRRDCRLVHAWPRHLNAPPHGVCRDVGGPLHQRDLAGGLAPAQAVQQWAQRLCRRGFCTADSVQSGSVQRYVCIRSGKHKQVYYCCQPGHRKNACRYRPGTERVTVHSLACVHSLQARAGEQCRLLSVVNYRIACAW